MQNNLISRNMENKKKSGGREEAIKLNKQKKWNFLCVCRSSSECSSLHCCWYRISTGTFHPFHSSNFNPPTPLPHDNYSIWRNLTEKLICCAECDVWHGERMVEWKIQNMDWVERKEFEVEWKNVFGEIENELRNMMKKKKVLEFFVFYGSTSKLWIWDLLTRFPPSSQLLPENLHNEHTPHIDSNWNSIYSKFGTYWRANFQFLFRIWTIFALLHFIIVHLNL